MIKSRKKWFAFLLLVTIASGIALTLGRAGTPPASRGHGGWVESRTSQLVFFAVLEGLYRDGVGNELVDLIIPPSTNGLPYFDPEHFVYSCPLCHPAFEAFRLYRQRETFFGLKAKVSTFGPGLDGAFTARLRSSDAGQRRQAIQELINRWVKQRLDIMRLSDAEHQAITREFEQGRKLGMNALKPSSQTRTNCPICDGSFGACKEPTR